MSFEDLKRSGKKNDLFIKFCGMLGSKYEGEIANAASKATALLREFDATWEDVTKSNSNGNESYKNLIQNYQNDINRLSRINNNLSSEIRSLREKLSIEKNKNYELNSKMHQLKNKLSDIEASIAQQKKEQPYVWKMEDNKPSKSKLRIPISEDKPSRNGWSKTAKALLQEDLTEWEENFINSILSRGSLTEKQEAVLNRMAEKYGV
jgi:chromosome segregation ATPase